MSKITPCLWFEKEAEEAVNFYVSLLPDSRIDHVYTNVAENPGGLPVDSVLMIEFTMGGAPFQALNGGVKMEYTHALSLSYSCRDQAELDRLWGGLSEGGQIVECGWLTDRYSISWQIVPEILPRLLADPDREKAARAMKAMLGMKKLDIATLEGAARG